MSRRGGMAITQRASTPPLTTGDYDAAPKRPNAPANVLRRPLRLPAMTPVKR